MDIVVLIEKAINEEIKEYDSKMAKIQKANPKTYERDILYKSYLSKQFAIRTLKHKITLLILKQPV